MTNHETDRRAQWANALWEAAEQNTIAEWICCDPINPKHGLCVAGGKALEMLRALIVDDPEAYKPAPLTTVALELAAVSVPPPAPRADDQAALRDRIRRAVCEAEGFMWNTELLEPDEYGEVADAVLAVLPESAPRADAEPDDGEGDELVCVDECGFCDACGFEPFGTPAEGWREAARFLRRTARDSGDRQGALHGARLIEAELRRLADESGPCVAGEQQNETPEAEEMFGGPDCTCIPFTRRGGTPRYCGPDDTVDMISGWERGADCLHHRPRP